MQRVYARSPRGIELGLHRVRAACESLGRPERRWGILHIAGTNGKGSVAATCALSLRNAGYRVGLFTSPHLCRFAERINIDGRPADDALLASALDRALRFEPQLTFFELTFVAALIAFEASSVDCAVLEVGLGGRLDATNVIELPIATAVTSIALDHTKLLGSTLPEIAREKASIAKPGAPMIIGSMAEPAEREVRRIAITRNAGVILGIGREIAITVNSHRVEVDLSWGPIALHPRLPGHHQLHNAAVAAALCCEASASLRSIRPSHVVHAAANVEWPARLESIRRDGTEILLDSAHNPEGIETLVSHVISRGVSPSNAGLVFGAMHDKAWDVMLRSAASIADHRFYVEPKGRTPAPLDDLERVSPGRRCRSTQEAIELAVETVGQHGLVIVCGSIFLAGEARAWLLGLELEPLVAL